MRAFIAIVLPEEIRAALRRLQRELAQSGADVRWVEPRHLHVTLKFLGEIAEPERQTVESLLVRIARAVGPFQLGLGTVEAFPRIESPRVIWVGLKEGSDRVLAIADAIERAGDALSLRKAERAFAPHLTVGRVRSAARQRELVGRLRTVSWEPPGPWQVGAVTLYRSVLGSSGPQHTVLADVPLGGGPHT